MNHNRFVKLDSLLKERKALHDEQQALDISTQHAHEVKVAAYKNWLSLTSCMSTLRKKIDVLTERINTELSKL